MSSTVPVANLNAGAVDVGPGLLYVAKIGTTEPTGLADTAWGDAWTEVGYTDKGSSFKVTPTIDDVYVAEEIDPVQSITTKVKAVLTVEMAQITAFNFAIAMGGGVITTGSGVTTFEPPAAGTEKELMVGWKSLAGDEAFLWRRVKPAASLSLDRTNGATKALIPAELSVLVPLTPGVAPWKWFGADPARTGPALSTIFA